MTRDEVQKKAKEIGHCVCCGLFTCPCKYFTDKNICKCSGEESNISFKEWCEYNQ